MIVYYCLTIIMILPIVLALSSIPFRLKQFSMVDINNPRPQAAKLKDAGERIVNAQKNAWEALAIFLTAIFIATSNNVPTEAIATACMVFVVARILHAFFYIIGNGILRFIAFFIGFASALFIISKAIF